MYFLLVAEVPILILLTVLYATSDEKQEMATALGVVLGTMILIFVVIFNLKLETRIDAESVSFRYFPFIRKWRRYTRKEIKSSELIKYSPIIDYGGWGFKGNKSTKAYSVLGDEGILLDVGEKKKIMIGTMKSKELRVFLENWRED
jgi:hypothetical protein